MASALPFLLLLLLGTNPGASPSFSLVQDCPPPDIVVSEGQTRFIKNDPEEGNYGRFGLLVMPECGFKGFSLTVEGTEGKKYIGWFRAERECFPSDGNWHDMGLLARIDSDDKMLQLNYWIGTCDDVCEMNDPPQGIKNFSLVAYGPSRWILGEPAFTCDSIPWSTETPESSLGICQNPPLYVTPTHDSDRITTLQPPAFPTSTSETSSSPYRPALPLPVVVGITVVVVSVLNAAVAVVVLVIIRRRRRNQQQRQQQQQATLSEVKFQSRPVNPTRQVQIDPAFVGTVRHQVKGDAHHLSVFQLSKDAEPHIYDTVNVPEDTATPGHEHTQVRESGEYINVQMYDDVNNAGEHTESPPTPEEHIYEVVL